MARPPESGLESNVSPVPQGSLDEVKNVELDGWTRIAGAQSAETLERRDHITSVHTRTC
jgi:hypothetical protein